MNVKEEKNISLGIFMMKILFSLFLINGKSTFEKVGPWVYVFILKA